MITTKNLSKRYGDKLAVDDLTFSVAPGEVLGFLGANGAGKSTTMRMIAGLHRPHGRRGHGVRARHRARAGRRQVLHGLSARRRAELRRDDGRRISRFRRRYPRPQRARGGASGAAS